MILAAHQPDLLPYPGFFRKLRMANRFDLAVHDQFQSHGYQRRVQMRGGWAQLPVRAGSGLQPICKVEIADGGPRRLRDTIIGRYRGTRFWKARWPEVEFWLEEAATMPLLWQHNATLLTRVRDWLGITTPFIVQPEPLTARGVDGLLEMCGRYRVPGDRLIYLSGAGGRAYMGDDPDAAFEKAGFGLVWMNWTSPTPDSILTLLFDDPEPRRWFE